ncbi:hypothetical protein ACUXVY_22970, partial [Chromobacterium haemolyticum]|uniref:hypothetical protein n=1 Tax=Chromobacterium haemolyticum TaxID=394935 RepID=UPI004057CB1D
CAELCDLDEPLSKRRRRMLALGLGYLWSALRSSSIFAPAAGPDHEHGIAKPHRNRRKVGSRTADDVQKRVLASTVTEPELLDR